MTLTYIKDKLVHHFLKGNKATSISSHLTAVFSHLKPRECQLYCVLDFPCPKQSPEFHLKAARVSTDNNDGRTNYESNKQVFVLSTSGVAERFEVEGQLLHTLPGLLIMLRVLWTGNQGNRLSLRNLSQNTQGDIIRTTHSNSF